MSQEVSDSPKKHAGIKLEPLKDAPQASQVHGDDQSVSPMDNDIEPEQQDQNVKDVTHDT